MSTPAVTPQPTLAQSVRAKYPGIYDDMDDVTLEAKVLAKYPQYSDMPRTQAQQLPQTDGTISNAPTGVLPWLKSVEGDVRYGTGQTTLGKILRGAGATGVGNSAATETMASPILGPIKYAKGVAEFSKAPWQGTKDMVGGIAQATALPSGLMAPEASEAVTDAIPSAKYAGKLFDKVKAAAGELPVNVSGAGDAALRAQELAENGGRMPTLLNKFIRKSTTPGAPDIDYNTARDFYSNSGQQSIWQKLSTSPQMQRQIGKFRSSLGDAIQATADQAGVGTEYRQALQEYHRAMVAQKVGKAALYLAAIKAAHDVFGLGAVSAAKSALSGLTP